VADLGAAKRCGRASGFRPHEWQASARKGAGGCKERQGTATADLGMAGRESGHCDRPGNFLATENPADNGVTHPSSERVAIWPPWSAAPSQVVEHAMLARTKQGGQPAWEKVDTLPGCPGARWPVRVLVRLRKSSPPSFGAMPLVGAASRGAVAGVDRTGPAPPRPPTAGAGDRSAYSVRGSSG
jgi:hypothetical protein